MRRFITKYVSAISFLCFMVSIGAVAQSHYIFSDESCLKNNSAEECFRVLTWDNLDQYISLTQDTTIAINDQGGSQFFLHYRQIDSFTLIELIIRKEDGETFIMPSLQVSADNSTYEDFILDQVKENDEFIGWGMSSQLRNEQRFFRLSAAHSESFIYFQLNPKS